MRRVRRTACLDWSSHSDTPARAKASAVLAFIVTKPGKTLFRITISSIQPRRTRQPMAMTINDEAREKDLSEEVRAELD